MLALEVDAAFVQRFACSLSYFVGGLDDKCGKRNRQLAAFGWRLSASAQLLQQRFRLLQIFGVKPLCEPAVDFRQHLPRFVLLALLLPEPDKARGGAEFRRLRLLSAGN